MVSELTGLEGGLEVGQKINQIIRAKADVNADTTGNAGTATKLQNARTITLSGDVSGSFSFDGSANKTVTTTLNDTTKIDGQWVSKTETLSTATAVGTYTIDLSSYLPNDNYNYEVFLFVFGEGGGTNVSGCFIYSSLVDLSNLVSTTTYTNEYATVYGTNKDTNNQVEILPVGSNKKLYMVISRHFNKLSIEAASYRRIGTNS